MLSADYANCNTISVTNSMTIPNQVADKMTTKIDFPRWLQKQMDEREWGQADLANEAKINRQVIYGWLKGKKPDEEYLIKVAHALQISPQEIFRAAGILPMESANDAITETIVHLIGDLDTTSKLRILEQIKLERRLSGKGKDNS